MYCGSRKESFKNKFYFQVIEINLTMNKTKKDAKCTLVSVLGSLIHFSWVSALRIPKSFINYHQVTGV